jgi:hypothetical protein
MIMSKKKLDSGLSCKAITELQECLELLLSIELIEYHNKNWLPEFAIRDNKILSEEKRTLIQRALSLTGTTASNRHT